ncbi:insulinase family protein [uncultured Neptuniibacter sp.]|uniref:insulinase family protein n=1 Tax=uncultured Neptuniibacter sp. TaxID=502143 RepID=UPI002610DA7F|nr:insulinase family protein [uncultured Neptuniibacter sp.]
MRCSALHKTIVSLLLFLLSTSSLMAQNTIEISPNDPKLYRSLTLDNQLRVLLISSPESDKAAASMNVAIGSSANPKDRPGLAHFLEHMLFLGTDKYPKADEYQSFISSHGGGHNAYTAQENTNYFFDVAADNLEPALDRFAQFFIAPLFDEQYVDRERHAVHSEYQAKIRDDYRRTYAVKKLAMNPENSQNRFIVGSLETLSDKAGSKIRDELIQFYQQYYSANLMTLVVLGREPLDQLEQIVRSKFSAVKNRKSQGFKSDEPLFLNEKLPLKVTLQSVKDSRSLSLTFPIAETRSHWRVKPVYYISSLIGYEGKGSLLSLLKARGWATSLSASQGHNLENQGSFMVNIALTEKGMEHYLDITQLLFAYVELLKDRGITDQLYTEEKQLNEISFRFQEQSEPIHLVSNLSRQMQHFPTQYAISASYKFDRFQPELIRGYLDQIRPENMLLTLKAKQLTGDQIEPYYNVPYSISPLTADELSRIKSTTNTPELSVRDNNPFIADNLELLSGSAHNHEVPVQLSKTPLAEHWYKQDTEFKTPKANVYFSLQTPIANQTAKNWVLNKLYTQMLQEQLNETLYDAYIAGLNGQIYPHMKGFTVRLSGYSDKLDLLLKAVADAIKHPELDKTRFEILRQEYIDNLANQSKNKPYNQATDHLYELLLPQWEKSSQQAALESLELDDLKQFSKQLLAAPYLKLMTHGNLSRAEAQSLETDLKRSLSGSESHPPSAVKVVQIPEGKPLTSNLEIEHNDSAIAMLLQGESNSLQARAEISVLAEMLAAPFYNQIRTEKQLGYIVFATPVQMNKTPGVAFIIQSPVADAERLNAEINGFIQQWQQQLPEIDLETLEKFKRSVIGRITKKDNTLSNRTNRYWRELDWGDTEFNTRNQLANRVEKVSIQDLKRCFEQLLKRRLIVQNTGKRFVSQDKTTPTTLHALFAELKADAQFVPES